MTSLHDFRQLLTYKSMYCVIYGYTFSDFCNRLIVKCWKQWNISTKFEKNRTKPGTVLSETLLSGDSLYNGFLWVYSFLAKNLAFTDPSSLKFHNRTDIKLYTTISKLLALTAALDNSLWMSGTLNGQWFHTKRNQTTFRNWHKVKTWLDQMFWQIYQKLMLSGFLSSGNLCLIHYLKLFWPHGASTASVRKGAIY